MSVSNKKIVIGITGGIAAYKMPDFIRMLVKEGAEVRAVCTSGGLEFVSSLVLETLTKYPVLYDQFEMVDYKPSHIPLAEWADVIFVAPATANFIARAANGFADELLLGIVLAANCPVGLAPSMNNKMWDHKATQTNLGKIREYGYKILEPDTGDLACGEGKGRLPDYNKLKSFLIELMT